MNRWKERYAVETDARTQFDAMRYADVFVGRLDRRQRRPPRCSASMADEPILFAALQPRSRDQVRACRRGPPGRDRGDRPLRLPESGQQLAGLPVHLPGRPRRAGAPDQPGDEAGRRRALAELAREDVPDIVLSAYGLESLSSGRSTSCRSSSTRARWPDGAGRGPGRDGDRRGPRPRRPRRVPRAAWRVGSGAASRS